MLDNYTINRSHMLTYLASPYSDPDSSVCEERFNAVTRAAAHFAKKGLMIFSPITHFHPMAELVGLPTGWEFWKKIDETYLRHCRTMYILGLDGWKKSVGVGEEMAFARERMPIYLADPVSYRLDLIGEANGR